MWREAGRQPNCKYIREESMPRYDNAIVAKDGYVEAGRKLQKRRSAPSVDN